MSLSAYKSKRRFDRTPEPKGKPRKAAGDLAFVVQKHAARRLHYDFRLEMDGVLKSWAVPKGPSLDPQKKALAVQVEDHPYDYKDFEGRIPEGQYGAGAVRIWDRGTWKPLEDAHKGLRVGKLKFELHGRRLRGEWALVRLHGNGRADKKNWLLMKLHDRHAHGDGADDMPGSKFPSDVQPQLATWVPHPPEGREWIHEVKFDGYRLIGLIQGTQPRLMTRGRQDWTSRFPKLAAELARLPVRDAIVDGEVVVLDKEGRSRFQSLQGAWKKGSSVDPVLYLFDLLYADGKDLRDQPLVKRKDRLSKLLTQATAVPHLKYSDHVQGAGDAVIEAACKMDLEGIISKRVDAVYRPGRSRDWLKSKCRHRQELVIVGYTDPRGSRNDFGSLLLGYHDGDGELKYAGKTGTGFGAKRLKEIKGQLSRLERDTAPIAQPPPARERRGVHWVEPKLVGEVEFAGWTGDDLVRQAAFLGLRPDKPAAEVVREEGGAPRSARQHSARANSARVSSARANRARKSGDDDDVQRVKLTNPQRVLFPDPKLTKSDLAAYYERVAERMLPRVVDRPLTLYRCPDGMAAKCFMQRHHTSMLPEAIYPVDPRHSKEKEPYLMIRDASGLRALVQISALEIHGWGSTVEAIDTPDQLVFDLDPDESFEWKRVKQAAQDLRELLRSLGLKPLVKTTGGKGLHLVTPIQPTVQWPQAKEYCKLIAEEFVRRDPGSFTTNMRKAARGGKMFVDYLRNDRTATAIVPYSVRARAGAPVAMPIDWKDLRSLRSADQFNVRTISTRLGRSDPWKSFDDQRVDLRKLLGAEIHKEKS